MNVSVIIASRNRESYINNLLVDLHQQILRPAEVIVVDQSDSPYNLVNQIDVHHIVDDQQGPSRARNLGLQHCHGDIIVFLDDDIRIENEFLQTLCYPIIQLKSSVVVGAMCNTAGKYPNDEYPVWKKNYRNWLLAITANLDYPGSHTTLSFTTCCSAIHKSVYEKVGGFDVFFDPDGAGEDREYGLRIFHAGYSILYEGKAAARHLGAPTGGRRGTRTGFTYLNALDANSVYIVAKYFGNNIFEEYYKNWLRSLRKVDVSLDIKNWFRPLLRYSEGKAWVKYISQLKNQNKW